MRTRYTLHDLASLADVPTEALADVVIVDEAAVDVADLREYRELRPELTMVYLVNGITPAKETFGTAYKISVLDAASLMTYLRTLEGSRNDQPVLTFWGILPQLGTTTIALSVATYLAQEYNLSVGVLGLNCYNPGSWAVTDPSYYLDDLRSFIRLKQLTPEKLKSSMDVLPSGVSYLLGNRNQTAALQFRPEDMSYLISTAKSAFEVVVLDAGSILNTAPALQALLSASCLYAVTTDLLYAQTQFQLHAQHALSPLGIDPEHILLVGNRMQQVKLLTAHAKAMGVTPLAAIPEMREIAYYAEQQPDKLRLFLDQRRWKDAMRLITEGIAAKYAMAAAASRKAESR
ncbi:MinD-like ATPase involved in chromosome partitioning or flagellar assembly [Alicyclobacillus macrosporangiidus]|uniref:MinD-like ATPase involved in chromosome partitioning or flagellar assembly n=1 Tax=Alicyclobacillus macrosporangiidus TaxID=392015 RepID=A0A1I7L1S0_9BACL|nr:MinD-like ATPase involved in chromosome partitioning or flagellar assembly [Alicyclobacillus macrosporangiidus]